MSMFQHAARGVAMALIGATLLLGSQHASAEPTPTRPTPVKHSEPPVANKVSLTLKVVHANNSGKVDPELRSVVENLKFTRFSGFNLLAQHQESLGPNQTATFDLREGRRIQLTLVSRDARAAKVRVKMSNASGDVMDTTVSIHRNRAFMIAGPDYQGGKLVLPIAVSY